MSTKARELLDTAYYSLMDMESKIIDLERDIEEALDIDDDLKCREKCNEVRSTCDTTTLDLQGQIGYIRALLSLDK